jgi:hypothetical protein
MASLETYDGTPSTGVNSVVATTIGFDGSAGLDPSRTLADEEVVHGATGSSAVEGVIISGYEDRYIRLFDANSGTYSAIHDCLNGSTDILLRCCRPMHIHDAGPPRGYCCTFVIS